MRRIAHRQLAVLAACDAANAIMQTKPMHEMNEVEARDAVKALVKACTAFEAGPPTLADVSYLEALADNYGLPPADPTRRLELLGWIKPSPTRKGYWIVTDAGLSIIREANLARIARPELEV